VGPEWALLGAAVVVSIPWAVAVAFLARAAAAELALAEDDRDEHAALSEHRRGLLEQAKLLLAEEDADGRRAAERRALLDDALAGAPAGDRLAAVERVLRAHAEHRARRAAEAGAPPAGPPAPG
jgi:hypothetical protein